MSYFISTSTPLPPLPSSSYKTVLSSQALNVAGQNAYDDASKDAAGQEHLSRRLGWPSFIIARSSSSHHLFPGVSLSARRPQQFLGLIHLRQHLSRTFLMPDGRVRWTDRARCDKHILVTPNPKDSV
ncbi:hypothetical protein RRG08_033420 [Elysia crispata]|uniref:Uncharacterized protein n=1 Tax=Elysia crispata TaxID=231223 RepID=A0AAE1E5R2_9GAST|nr:hypothetical protein RRG08_033420 [Elysia crispata]